MLTTSSEDNSFVSSMEWFWNPYVEHCGILTSRGEVIEIPNTAEAFGGDFAMTKEDVEHACDVAEIVGIFHTHPSNNPEPSILDVKGWPGPGYRYFIVTQGRVTEWKRNDDRSTLCVWDSREQRQAERSPLAG